MHVKEEESFQPNWKSDTVKGKDLRAHKCSQAHSQAQPFITGLFEALFQGMEFRLSNNNFEVIIHWPRLPTINATDTLEVKVDANVDYVA